MNSCQKCYNEGYDLWRSKTVWEIGHEAGLNILLKMSDKHNLMASIRHLQMNYLDQLVLLGIKSMRSLEELVVHHMIWGSTIDPENMADWQLLSAILQNTIFGCAGYWDYIAKEMKSMANGLPDNTLNIRELYEMKRKFSLKLLVQFHGKPGSYLVDVDKRTIEVDVQCVLRCWESWPES